VIREEILNMYTLITTFVKSKEPFSQWEEIDSSNIRCIDLFNQYREVVFVLQHPILPETLSLDAEEIRTELSGTEQTVAEMLVLNGNNTLPTQHIIPELKQHFVKYQDAFRAGYKVWLTDGSSSIDDQGKDGKTGIKLTREDTDFEHFYKHILVSINGYIHATDYDVNGAYVRDCVKSLDIAQVNHVGLISFENLGELHFEPITEDKLFKLSDNRPMKDGFGIKIDSECEDCTVLLVIGGYLHTYQDGLFIRTGVNLLNVDFSSFNFLDRYLDSRRFLDLTQLGLSQSPINPYFVSKEELYSDEVITKYLTMSQSFIVLLKAKDVIKEKVFVFRNGKGLLSYGSGIKPDYPLFMARGVIGNYWSKTEFGGLWSLSVQENRDDHYLYRTTNEDELDNIDDARTGAFPYWPFRSASAYLAKISTTTIW